MALKSHVVGPIGFYKVFGKSGVCDHDHDGMRFTIDITVGEVMEVLILYFGCVYEIFRS